MTFTIQPFFYQTVWFYLALACVARGEAGAEPRHFGLVGMRERVEKPGGRFSIASRPGEGTRAVAELPLTPPSASLREPQSI